MPLSKPLTLCSIVLVITLTVAIGRIGAQTEDLKAKEAKELDGRN